MKHTIDDKKIVQIVGRNLQRIRINRGLSQSDLAKLCGRSQRLVGSWEQGINFPSPSALATLKNVLGVSWGTLFYGVGGEERA